MRNIYSKLRAFLLFIGFNLVAVVMLVLLCEGFASVVLLAQNLTFSPVVAERSHTRYDAELGWVNLPNIYIENMYGPGRHLQINEQGFRNAHNFSQAVPKNQRRIICSGDSFTLGYGVDNYNNWCSLLESINDQWQTVNMGQGGYGLGQSYLWYKRDGARLEHNIHLFAFITRDFERMQRDSFLGYGKPLLTVKNDQLVLDNVPVPARAFYLPWLTQNSETLKRLRLTQLLSQLFISPQQDQTADSSGETTAPKTVVAKIFKDLQQINQQKNSTLVLVYLPTWGDYDPAQAGDTEMWRQFIDQTAREANITFIDLIDDFRETPADQIHTMFIHQDDITYPGAVGHYSVRGNEFVAQRLYDHLMNLPETAENVANQSR